MARHAQTLGDVGVRKTLQLEPQKRQPLPFNQRELAETLGKTQSYVAKVELHERRLDIVQLVEWLRALEVDERKFFAEILKDIPATKQKR
ncbi:helix-turn-helix domain-containing protein [Vitreimonas flagellata]|uniref:helix-turn-helix domain-containing protein n=1 Tax=Vitreimonas flagellata TaxID=2560861 RepID=UPI001EF88E13|nr:helix-turn-helix transcriptional regulator [Vitreimonas flagellata]